MKKKLSPEEENLWKTAMKEVKRLPKVFVPEAPSSPSPLPKKRAKNALPLRPAACPSPSFDKKSFRRIKAEAHFDMHGLTLQAGAEALERFLREAQRRGVKTVLVVTGKGAIGATNTLRYHLPFWLKEPPFSQLVCAFHHPAKLQDGGTGAFYLELRKPAR